MQKRGTVSPPAKPKGSLKARMKQYEEECRRRKEIEKKETISVGQLDEDMTDVTKFIGSPRKAAKKKALDVKIHKLSDDLKLEFENSFSVRDDSNNESGSNLLAPESPKREWKYKSKNVKDAEEKKAREELVEILKEDPDARKEVTLANNEKVSLPGFSSIRNGYLMAVTKMKPDPVPQVTAETSAASSGKRPFKVKKADRKKEAKKVKQYQRLMGAWDSYHERAQDKPEEPTQQDKQIEAEVKKVERDVNNQWQDYAREVFLHKQEDGGDSDSDNDDDEMEFWLAEAKRLQAEAARKKREEARRRAEEKDRKRREMEEMLEGEDEDIVAQAMRLRDEARKKKAAEKAAKSKGSADKEEGQGVRKGKADLSLRPGMNRGHSFDDDASSQKSTPESDEEDQSARKGKADFSIRPGMNRGHSFGDDSDAPSGSDSEEESKRKCKPDLSMRPGTKRGHSFDDDEAPPEEPTSEADEEDSPHRGKARGMRGNSFADDDASDVFDNEAANDKATANKKVADDSDSSSVSSDTDDSAPKKSKKQSTKKEEKSKKKDKKNKKSSGDFSDSESESDDSATKKKSNSKKDNKSIDKNSVRPKSKWLSNSTASTDSDSDVSSVSSEDGFKTPPKSKKKKVKDIELKEDVLASPKTPRNADGTKWVNPLRFWANKPRKKVKIVGNQLSFKVPEKTDCWRKTRHNFIMDNAPFHSQKVIGDFECIVKIFGGFSKMYDKAGIMVRLDEENWLLSGMEFFNDRVNHSTSVTKDFTDWSLSPLPEKAEKAGVWFCVKRTGHSYEAFYSFDGKKWVQTRQGIFTERPVLHVGICAACPMGDEFKVTFEGYQLKKL